MSAEPLLIAVDSLAYGGDGVGRMPDGRVCFIPGAFPGEEVEILPLHVKKNFVRAQLQRVIRPSADRLGDGCPLAIAPGRVVGYCPGCPYASLEYAAELTWKQRQLEKFLCGPEFAGAELLAPVPSPADSGYRNKVNLHRALDGRYGYVAEDNHSVLPVSSCRLLCRKLNDFLDGGLSFAGPEFTARFTGHDGVTAFEGRSAGPRDWLTEHLPGFGDFKVPADGFWQTNNAVAELLVRRVVSEIQRAGGGFLTELYCGVGLFSIAAASAIPGLKCTGVEINAAAIRAARFNAGRHRVEKRCRFLIGDAGRVLSGLPSGETGSSILLVDPPRGGLSSETLAAIAAAAPPMLIYISCAPDTLQRDLKILRTSGYRLQRAGLLDMFPRTAHFEVSAVLRRQTD